MTTKQWKRQGIDALMAMGLLAWCGASQGLGLGQVNRPATMGEGLSLDVPLRLAPGEQLADDCLSADVYFGDDKVAGFKVAVSLSRDSQGAPTVHVATSSRVSEPVVTVYVAAGCASHVTRKYVVLADPPGLALPAVSPARDEVPMAFAEAAGPLAPRKPQVVRDARSGHASARSGHATAQRGGAHAPAFAQAHVARRKPVTVAEAAGARLQIDPVAADALVVPTLRMGATLTLPTDAQADSPALRARRAAAAAYWRALQTVPENWAQDQARLAELERRVLDMQALRDQLAVARQASAVAPASSAVAPRFERDEDEVLRIRIVGLVGVALFGLLAWGRMRAREREEGAEAGQNWWQGWLDGERSPSAQPVAPSRPALGQAATTAPQSVRDGDEAMGAASGDGADLHTRHASVEALIDLAQQTELFVVLGQDDAAQALLEDHVQQAVDDSPMPHLLLLELLHRRHQRPGYERARQVFEARFHVAAPAWDHAEQLQGRPLADMPVAAARVQAARAQPELARAVLAQLIAQPPEAGAETLGLLAYRDLVSAFNELPLAPESVPGSAPFVAALDTARVATPSMRPAQAVQAEAGGVALSC